MFHGDQKTITLVTTGGNIYTYNMYNGTQPQMGNVPLSIGSESYTHWAHEDTLRFAVCLKTDGGHIIYIKEFQATPTSQLHTLSSFPILPQDGVFSFSPVSLHASFVNQGEAIVLDIQDSRLLLHTQTFQEKGIKQGQFSPNGQFFACMTSYDKINIWQNTPTGYISWRSLRPRLEFDEFWFSPTAVSISCLGTGGIQLLELGNDPHPLPSIDVKLCHNHQDHLVAYSADWGYIAMARQGSSIVTVLNCSLGNPQQLTNPDMEVQDIKIVDNTLFVVDRCKLVCWDLEADRTEDSAHSTRRVVVETLAIDPDAEVLILSHDCSQIAFVIQDRTVFLHDLRAPGLITKYGSPCDVVDLRFSPDQCRLWLLTAETGEAQSHPDDYPINFCLVGLGMSEGGGVGDVVSESLETVKSWINLPSHGCFIGTVDSWVEDPKGNKLLWLPPNWRPGRHRCMKWNGDFLALAHGLNPEPVIIQFHL